MSQNSQITLPLAGPNLPGPQSRTQKPFVPRKITLNLPTLIVSPARKATVHLASVLTLGSSVLAATPTDRDNRQRDSQFFPGQSVIRLGIKTRIGQEAIETQVTTGLNQGRSKMRSIIIRSSGDDTGTEQVCLGLADGRNLRPAGVALGSFVLAPMKVMSADMMGFQPRRIDGSFGFVRQQPQGSCPVKNRVQEAFKSPFFSSFCSA